MGDMADWTMGRFPEFCDDEEYLELDADVVTKTDKALLVKVDGEEEEWVPLSLVSEESDLGGKSLPGDKGVIFIPYWVQR